MRYDTHIHSKYSKDSFNEPSEIIKMARKVGLDGIAVTDHNSICGGIKTHKLNKDKDFEVIVGEEVMTNHGELLAYYLNEEIPSGLPVFDAIDRIRDQGGLISVAHPFSRGIVRKAFTLPLAELRGKNGKVDALEGWNARMIFKSGNLKSQISAINNGFALTGGSDAHFVREIGRGYVEFEGTLEKALRQKKTLCGGVLRNSFWYRIFTVKNLIAKRM